MLGGCPRVDDGSSRTNEQPSFTAESFAISPMPAIEPFGCDIKIPILALSRSCPPRYFAQWGISTSFSAIDGSCVFVVFVCWQNLLLQKCSTMRFVRDSRLFFFMI